MISLYFVLHIYLMKYLRTPKSRETIPLTSTWDLHASNKKYLKDFFKFHPSERHGQARTLVQFNTGERISWKD
jgi:hypothetical protein